MHHKDIAEMLRGAVKAASGMTYEHAWMSLSKTVISMADIIEKDRETIRCFIVSSEDSADTTKDLDSVILNLKKGEQ